ncbi:glutamate synthase family protein [Flavobacterium limnosediminis JC2902]|uniref:Glutamate synthase family protein n=1 Tax=Flavobacterium limnosediminis JC2902 TaxID=1341181 RepID=V6SQR1_9FLAO|nr:FMN-binding glutamate synthase family protein [Flavobacterium limnosediminis]ESU28784.1 glutamate synthase family protein [Flavobacterium limnosediminis JC2902]
MAQKKLFSKLTARQIIWMISIGFLLGTIFLLYQYKAYFTFLIAPMVILSIVLTDSFQTKHSVRKNYPLIGRLRYIFESFRPEFRQYFFEGELDGKPFNRRQRSIVYQRAKNEKQTISFGMQDDPNRIGYEWAAHSMYPKKTNIEQFRTIIGNSQCLQPYSASIYNISAMSYGALSKTAITSLNKGAQLGNFAHNTGEGGISDYHLQGGDLIWQIGTGYFGCRDEKGGFSETLFADKANYPQVKMIELKLSQGAKPGHGGLLPAEKNTPEIAAIRSIKPHTTVHSPSGHTAFSNAHELILFIDKLRTLSKGKPVGFKICIGRKDEFIDIVEAMIKTGIYPDFITVDGAEGGTGAAPLEFIDYMGMALSDAVVFVNRTLTQFGIREHIKILASGKIISAFDIAKTIALGADACYSARGMMFALGCIQALQCDSGKCPVGIATQDKSLYKGLDVTDKSVRVANFHKNTLKALGEFIGACGFDTLSKITPDVFYKRTDLNSNQNFTEIYFSDRIKSKREIINLN